jgi:hypothetical protein
MFNPKPSKPQSSPGTSRSTPGSSAPGSPTSPSSDDGPRLSFSLTDEYAVEDECPSVGIIVQPATATERALVTVSGHGWETTEWGARQVASLLAEAGAAILRELGDAPAPSRPRFNPR